MYMKPMNGPSGLHLNPNSTVILALESKISCGNDSLVNVEFFGEMNQRILWEICQNNIVHKAFLNELSSCKQTSNIYLRQKWHS